MNSQRVDQALRTVVFAAVAALLVAGCQVGSRSSMPPTPSVVAPTTLSPSVASPMAASPVVSPTANTTTVPSTIGDANCGSADISVDYAPYTIADLVSYGWDFAVGSVVGLGPAAFNTADGKAPPGFGSKPSGPNPNAEVRIYTQVQVQLEDSLTGSRSTGRANLLTEGGTVGCYTTRVDVAPDLLVGSRYVFVLADAVNAAGNAVPGRQEIHLAWPINADGIVATDDGPISISELRAKVSSLAPASAAP